jgi:hypothetical protein
MRSNLGTGETSSRRRLWSVSHICVIGNFIERARGGNRSFRGVSQVGEKKAKSRNAELEGRGTEQHRRKGWKILNRDSERAREPNRVISRWVRGELPDGQVRI